MTNTSKILARGNQTYTDAYTGTAPNNVNVVYGGVGNDTITYTGTVALQSLTLHGGTGVDSISNTGSGVVNEWLSGGTSGSKIIGGNVSGTEYLTGQAGSDLITSGVGNALIVGGISGNDTITAGAGNHTITGGSGHDSITVTDASTTAAHHNLIQGGSGNTYVNLNAISNSFTSGSTTTYAADTITGGSGSDTLLGSNTAGVNDWFGNSHGAVDYMNATLSSGVAVAAGGIGNAANEGIGFGWFGTAANQATANANALTAAQTAANAAAVTAATVTGAWGTAYDNQFTTTYVAQEANTSGTAFYAAYYMSLVGTTTPTGTQITAAAGMTAAQQQTASALGTAAAIAAANTAAIATAGSAGTAAAYATAYEGSYGTAFSSALNTALGHAVPTGTQFAGDITAAGGALAGLEGTAVTTGLTAGNASGTPIATAAGVAAAAAATAGNAALLTVNLAAPVAAGANALGTAVSNAAATVGVNDHFANINNVLGSGFNDSITASAAGGHIWTNSGNDTINVGVSGTLNTGNETITGGVGNKVYHMFAGTEGTAAAATGGDVISGGSGSDTLDFSGVLTNGVTQTSAALGLSATSGTYTLATNIAGVYVNLGGNSNDTLQTTPYTVNFAGSAGEGTISNFSGTNGTYVVNGSTTLANYMVGATGVTLNGGTQSDTLVGGQTGGGHDILVGQSTGANITNYDGTQSFMANWMEVGNLTTVQNTSGVMDNIWGYSQHYGDKLYVSEAHSAGLTSFGTGYLGGTVTSAQETGMTAVVNGAVTNYTQDNGIYTTTYLGAFNAAGTHNLSSIVLDAGAIQSGLVTTGNFAGLTVNTHAEFLFDTGTGNLYWNSGATSATQATASLTEIAHIDTSSAQAALLTSQFSALTSGDFVLGA